MTRTAQQKDAETRRWLVDWAQRQDAVRALILTSSRANPFAPVDAFSDYDVILVVQDIRPYYEEDAWLQDFGRVLVVYRDPIRQMYGYDNFARITQYENATKIDYTIWPVEILERVAAEAQLPEDFDVGYQVLVDKDHLTDNLKPPTYHGYIPKPPSLQAYLTVVEEFFHEGTYLVKYLWRGDLMPVKYFLDMAMKQDNLQQMLVWYMESLHGWSVKPGVLGRGLARLLPADLWTELEATYTGAGCEENWEALFHTIDLFHKVAAEVGQSLGYAYPVELEQRVVAYFLRIRQLDPQAEVIE